MFQFGGDLWDLDWTKVLSVLVLILLFAVGWWWAIVKKGRWNSHASTSSFYAADQRLAILAQQQENQHASNPNHPVQATTYIPTVIGTKKAKKLERKAQRREFTAHQQAMRQREEEAALLAWELDQECRERDRLLQQPATQMLKAQMQQEKEQQRAQRQKEMQKLQLAEERLREKVANKAICPISQEDEPVLNRLGKNYSVLREGERVLVVDNSQLDKLSDLWLHQHENASVENFFFFCLSASGKD